MTRSPLFARRIAAALACATALQAGGKAIAADVSSTRSIETIGAPEGFDQLSQPREIIADVYFGGRKLGEAAAIARPGFLNLKNPAAVAAMVPRLADAAAIASALKGDLPTNSALACSQSNRGHCGELSPQIAGIIYDEDHFRVDLFVDPHLLETAELDEQTYLASPTAPLSFTTSFGVAIAGSDSTSLAYNFQDRAIVGFRNARVRADSSYSSGFGLLVDDLVGEVDTHDLRYSGGLFWAPGLDLIGQRRIVGIGVGTQFDTRADRDLLQGTPLVLFLAQPARVEVLIDGRLVGSRTYDAGNVVIDSSGLPDGSYPLVLRIHEANGSVRDEHRFFVRNAQVAPVGQPLYFGYVGMLANTRRNRVISPSDTLYYQFGTARRLSPKIAVDASIIGTQKKTMAELGGWLLTPVVRVRAAGLLSTAGDKGALLQLASSDRAPVTLNFDVRRIWSHDGRPLIPVPALVDTFGATQPTGAQIGGSYTQGSGSVGLRLGAAYLGVIGTYRKNDGDPADYSVGPNAYWPFFNRAGLQLIAEGNAQKGRTASAVYAGLRLLFTGGRISASTTAGWASLEDGHGSKGSSSRAVGSLEGHYFYEGADRTQVMFGGGVQRNVDSSAIRADGAIYSRFGNVQGDVLHTVEGQGSTQYGVTFQSGVAVAARGIAVGGRDLADSAVIVSISGDVPDAKFEVLVNEAPRGRISAGGRLPIFLQPYHSYSVRVRALDAAAVDYDSSAHEITLYPGNVQAISWSAASYFTMFGQAVRADGSPVANAMVRSKRGVGQTDSNGYFQVDASGNEAIALTGSGAPCDISAAGAKPENDFASMGKVVCR